MGRSRQHPAAEAEHQPGRDQPLDDGGRVGEPVRALGDDVPPEMEPGAEQIRLALRRRRDVVAVGPRMPSNGGGSARSWGPVSRRREAAAARTSASLVSRLRVLRIGFGVVWALDAYLKWKPAFIDQYGDEGHWCYADERDVRQLFESRGFADQIRIVRGDVLQTLQDVQPQSISVLRLDTDWYESTKLELELLYPLISPTGIMIVDDYGHWEGSRAAVEEYFSDRDRPLFSRITPAVRMAVVG